MGIAQGRGAAEHAEKNPAPLRHSAEPLCKNFRNNLLLVVGLWRRPLRDAEMRSVLLITLFATATYGKGCTAVPKDKCGKDFDHSCLKCGTKSDYDCEECCPGCTPVDKPPYKYCDCSKGPPPGPPPGNDTWTNYSVGPLAVTAVTGGKDAAAYDTAVVMLHGGGGSGADWQYQYDNGWLGNLSGFKYVFPTSAYSSHVWFETFKAPGCGLDDDCAYNKTSIAEAAGWVEALIEHEASLLGGDHKQVYLVGFSEGAQLTGYMQLAQLKYALGGVAVLDGFPLPPLFDWKDGSGASYKGSDMRWMLWHGADDPIFPANFTLTAWDRIFDILGASSTKVIEHTEPGMTHTLVKPEFDQLARFVRGGT